MKRFLITTSIKETWVSKEPVLFLGEWCYSLDDKTDIESLDFTVEKNIELSDGVGIRKYVESLYAESIKHIALRLNEMHKIQRSNLYWERMLGWWLRDFIHMQYHHWMLLKNIEARNIASNTILLRDFENKLSTKTMLLEGDMNVAVHSSLAFIIKYHTQIPYSEIDYFSENCCEKIKKVVLSKKVRIGRGLAWLFKKVKYFNNRKLFFIGMTIPFLDSIKIDLLGGKLPISWVNDCFYDLPSADNLYNSAMRGWSLGLDHETEFEKFFTEIIAKRLPRDLVENYDNVIQSSKILPFPDKVGKIVTSNWPKANCILSAWCAERLEDEDASLVMLQHGGNYGIDKYYVEKLEVDISDMFLTWGWDDNSGKVHPLFFHKKLPEVSYEKGSERLTIVPLDISIIPRGFRGPQAARLVKNVFTELDELIQLMSREVQEKIWLRGFKNETNLYQYYKNKYPHINIDDTFSEKNSLQRSVDKSKLFIITYNSTLALETLAANIPTILYWTEDMFPIRSSALPYFDLLRKDRIFHDSAESVALHVNEIWRDVHGWWHDVETQKAREQFCARFAKSPKDYRQLNKIICCH